MLPERMEKLHCKLEIFNQTLRIGFAIYHVKYRENSRGAFKELVYIQALEPSLAFAQVQLLLSSLSTNRYVASSECLKGNIFTLKLQRISGYIRRKYINNQSSHRSAERGDFGTMLHISTKFRSAITTARLTRRSSQTSISNAPFLYTMLSGTIWCLCTRTHSAQWRNAILLMVLEGKSSLIAPSSRRTIAKKSIFYKLLSGMLIKRMNGQ